MMFSDLETMTFMAKDGEEVVASVSSLRRSDTLRFLLSGIAVPDEKEDQKFPLEQITSATLRQILMWLEKHEHDEDFAAVLKIPVGGRTPKLPDWDQEFLTGLEQTDFLRVLNAAEYLQIDELVEMCCRIIADTLRYKSTEEIRAHWNVETGWTKEEEKQIAKKYRWCSKGPDKRSK